MGGFENTRSKTHEAPYDPLLALRMIRPDLIGVVFHLSWLFLLFYSSALSLGSPVGGPVATDIVYFSSALVLAVTLFVGCVRTKQFMRACESRIGTVAAPAITSAGTLLYCVNQAAPSLALVWTAGVLTGIGSAALAARWASVFGNTSSRTIIANFPTILAIIVAICLSIDYLPYELCLALIVALPLCSGAALQFARRYQRGLAGANAGGVQNQERAVDVRRSAHYVPLVVLVGLIGFTVALLPSFEVAGANYGLLFYLITAVLVLGFVGTAIFFIDRRSLLALFIVPLGVLALVVVPFASYAAASLGDAIYPVGNIAFELMLLFGTVLFALLTDQSPARTFMVARMTLAVFDFAGAYVGERIAAAGSDTAVVQLASVGLFASSELLIVALVVSYFANRRGKLRDADGARGVSASEASDSADIPAEGPTREQRILQLAERFGLSEREQDVFALLAEGRSSARIQEDLCIAAGTVNYHTRNIYQKLDVHSRQEIIDLVHDRLDSAK